MRPIIGCAVLAAVSLLSPASADPIAVRQAQGSLHGFLALSTLDGVLVASGDFSQISRGGIITSRLTFRFKDGSLQDGTTVFSQSGRFHLILDHLVQKGPAFKRQIDQSINVSRGVATVQYADDKGNDKTDTSRLKLPPDLANGIVPILLMNLPPGSQSATLSMVVATPKPQIVKLLISAEGEDSFSVAGVSYKAVRYVIKMDIGGVRGVVAPLVGKQPPDTRVWILSGSAPVFVKSEGPLCEGGPVLRMELTSPVWTRGGAPSGRSK
jgi:hypothetical protein